jgi:hypothetical protein
MIRSAILLGVVLAIGADTPADPLEGKRFLSVERLAGGDRPDGTVNQIHWEVKFKDKSYSWSHSDKLLTGGYEFDAKTGAVKTDDPKIKASYDAKTGVLTWGKHEYKAAKDEK